MPIPGPSESELLDDITVTGSPYSLCISGVWLPVEGVTPGVTQATERATSEVVTIDGNRYAQRAPAGRRQWDLAFTYADTPTIAALRVAAELDTDVWLMSEAVGLRNMLPARSCFGTNATPVSCGGVPLPSFVNGDAVAGRVRGGVATTLAAWFLDNSAPDVLTITYPGGTTTLPAPALGSLVPLQGSVTFTPTTDGPVTITIATTGPGKVSGLTLTEGPAPSTWVGGENMPCKVSVPDPDDSLTMHHGGAWRHDYSVALREVG